MTRFAIIAAPWFLFAPVATGDLKAQPPHDAGIVIETGDREAVGTFECRIPVKLHWTGGRDLRQFRIVAEVLDDGRKLASTGFTSEDRVLVAEPVPGGRDYVAAPRQFGMTLEHCRQADALRIVFATCAFGDAPATDCMDRVRFAKSENDDPLYLSLRG